MGPGARSVTGNRDGNTYMALSARPTHASFMIRNRLRGLNFIFYIYRLGSAVFHNIFCVNPLKRGHSSLSPGNGTNV